MVCVESENVKTIKVNPRHKIGREALSLKFWLMCEGDG